MDVPDKSSKNWLAQEVEQTFGIKRTRHSNPLDRWLNATPGVTELRRIQVEQLRVAAERDIDAWNEAVIKFYAETTGA